MASLVYANAQSNTGTCTLTQPGSPGVVWNCSSISVSYAGPTVGPNAKLTVYDGAVGGSVLYAVYLGSPGTGSVGVIQEIPMPKTYDNKPCLQASPGNAMNIQVTGTGGNQVSINARFNDGLT